MTESANQPKRASLSARQKQIYEYIKSSLRKHGYPPTMREIGDAVGMSSLSSVAHQLNRLEDLGYIHRNKNQSRCLELMYKEEKEVSDDTGSTLNESECISVPLVGQVAAGIPITAEQCIEDVMTFPSSLLSSGNLFMLRVVGDSMIDAAICDGDYVIVREQSSAENGEIVVAMLEGEATVKVFRARDGHIWLLPRNSSFEPILGDEAQILGKVIAVFRAGL